jgi:hypothetical protein
VVSALKASYRGLRGWVVAQVVEYLLSRYEALSLNLSAAKINK